MKNYLPILVIFACLVALTTFFFNVDNLDAIFLNYQAIQSNEVPKDLFTPKALVGQARNSTEKSLKAKDMRISSVLKKEWSEESLFIIMDWGYGSADFVLSNFRALESILSVYPNAKVRVLTSGPVYANTNHFGNSLPKVFFQKYQKRGYDVEIHLLKTRQTNKRIRFGRKWLDQNKEKHFYHKSISHAAFVKATDVIPKYYAVAFLRFLQLWLKGGIFADFTTLFIRPIPKSYYGYTVQPPCSVQETSGKYWEPMVMRLPEKSSLLECVLMKYDSGEIDKCAEKSTDEGASCVRRALRDCSNKISFENVLEDSDVIQWFGCDSSIPSKYFRDKDSAEDYDMLIEDENKYSAFWLGPDASNGMWQDPEKGSFMDLAFKAARSNADRWAGKQNDPRCSTICHHYDNTTREHEKEKLAGKMNCAPGVMVPGTQKGASTFVFHAITSHPQVLQPLRGAHTFKEAGRYLPQFGHGNWKVGVRLQGYPFIEEDEHFISGDGTVIYMDAGMNIPNVIFRDNPHCKFVFALRNPTERAYSDYRFMYHTLKGTPFNHIIKSTLPEYTECFASFQSSNTSDPEYEAKGIQQFYRSKCSRPKRDKVHLVKKGLYYFQVRHFMNIFGPSNIHIVDAGELKQDQRTTLNSVVKFLGLCEYDYGKLRKEENVNGANVPSHESMTEDVYNELQNWFAPFNKRLYGLIGRDLKWEKDKFKKKRL